MSTRARAHVCGRNTAAIPAAEILAGVGLKQLPLPYLLLITRPYLARPSAHAHRRLMLTPDGQRPGWNNQPTNKGPGPSCKPPTACSAAVATLVGTTELATWNNCNA